jgi:hypothetical protein
MTNQWYLFILRNTRFFTTDWLYRWFKKPFSKDAHVIDADELTKVRYNTFREKLYNLYVELHKGFPQSEGKKYETNISELVFTKINIKLEETCNKLKAKAEAAAKAEANEEKERAYKETNEAEEAETDVATNETADDTNVNVKSSTATTTQPQPSATTTQPQPSTTTATSTQPPQPSTATQQPSQSPEEEITKKALQKVKEAQEARMKATANVLDAKANVMKMEEEAKEKMEALAKQKAELEAKARTPVLNSREAIANATQRGIKGSTNFTALLDNSQQITKAQGAIDNLKGDVGKEANNLMKGYSNFIKTTASNKTDGFTNIFPK